MTSSLIISIISLSMVNILVGVVLYRKRPNTTPTIESMKSITKVYETLNSIINNTKAYKVGVSKVCVSCETPYAEMLYDNTITDEERYNIKYNRIEIDEAIVRELKAVSKGRVVSVNVDDLPSGIKKTLYSSEGITYSETHKIVEVNQYLYVLVIHYRIPIDEVDEDEVYRIRQHLSTLIQIFEDNRSKL